MKQQITDLTIGLVKANIPFKVDEYERVNLTNVTIGYWDRSGYFVSANKRWANITQETLNKILYKKDENNMFKLNFPKLMERVKQLEARMIEADKIDAENKAKKDKFVAKMLAEGAKFYHGKFNQGEINRNGIRYTFEIHEDGYVREGIEIASVWTEESKFERFQKLSKNGFEG